MASSPSQPPPPPSPPFTYLKLRDETNDYWLYESRANEGNIVHVKEFKVRGGEAEQEAEKILKTSKTCKSEYICRAYDKYSVSRGPDTYDVYPSEGYTDTLYEFFERRRLQPEKQLDDTFLQIFLDLARGLRDLHCMGISHSNIKQESLVVINNRGKINGALGGSKAAIHKDYEDFGLQIQRLFPDHYFKRWDLTGRSYQFKILLSFIQHVRIDGVEYSPLDNIEHHPFFLDNTQMMKMIVSISLFNKARNKMQSQEKYYLHKPKGFMTLFGGMMRAEINIRQFMKPKQFGQCINFVWDWRTTVNDSRARHEALVLLLRYEIDEYGKRQTPQRRRPVKGGEFGTLYDSTLESFLTFCRNFSIHFENQASQSGQFMGLEEMADWINKIYPEFTSIMHFGSILVGMRIGAYKKYK